MDAVALNETPSAARRRLSIELDAGAAAEALKAFAAAAETETDEPQDAPVVGGGARRISILPRRASAWTRFFALGTVSDSFAEAGVRPTVINAMIFLNDPQPDVEKLRYILSERLLSIPRFRCMVRSDDGEGGNKIVKLVPLARSDVDMERHVKHVDGRGQFGLKEINVLMNETYLSTPWSSEFPLWRMTVVSNLSDGRSLLFLAVDHAIGDGVGLMSVFLSLLDDDDDDENNKKTGDGSLQKKRKKPQLLRWPHLTVAALSGLKSAIVDNLVPPARDPNNSFMVPKTKLHHTNACKIFAQTKAFPLNEIKSIKNKLKGATVNDVIMALLTMAVRTYLENTGSDDDRLALKIAKAGKGKLRCVFPVNMRQGKIKSAQLGNNVVNGSISYPVGYSDPIDCLWRCKTAVDELKLSPAFYVSKALGDFIFYIVPDTLIAPDILDLMSRPMSFVSNVMGPSGGASLGGYAIDDLNFTVTFMGSMYFGVLTYGGGLRISVVLDERANADAEDLIKCVEKSYEELKGCLDNVDEKAPLERPDMTPLSAKILEVLVYMAIAVVPVFVSMKMMRCYL